jgi:hypothetical protein
VKRITIVTPTINGREEMLTDILEAYRTRSAGFDLTFITVKNYPNWPAGCNAGQLLVRDPYDYIFFGADDVEPCDGWATAMAAVLERGVVPAARFWDHVKTDGPPVNEGADGPPGAEPTFARGFGLTPTMAEAVGPWPEIPYFADNWVSDKLRLCGYRIEVTAGFDFVHHWHQVGRLDAGDWWGRYVPLYNAERAKLGLGPI